MTWRPYPTFGTASGSDVKDLNGNLPLISVLIVLTVLSFVPQVYRIVSHRTCAGLSITYVLLNLMTATENFALVLLFYSEKVPDGHTFVHQPRTVGDLLNLIQLGLIWVCFAILFTACIILPTSPQRMPKAVAISLYIPWMVITFFVGVSYILHERGAPTDPWERLLPNILHFFILTPLATIFRVASLAPQVRLIQSRSDPGAVSSTALAIQALIFALNAILWPQRVYFDWERWSKLPPGIDLVLTWYWPVGFVAVDAGVLAAIQGFLLGTLISHRRGNSAPSPETQPLLFEST